MPMQGGDSAILNPSNLGPAWFVNSIRYESTPQAVMNAIGNFNAAETAILFSSDQQNLASSTAPGTDSIWLVSNENDDIVYRYTAASPRFAVFSEIYYNKGWRAYVDGQELPIVRTNYVLRGVKLPAGQNKEVRFEFRPASFYTGEKIASVAGIIIYLLLIGAIALEVRRNAKSTGTIINIGYIINAL